MLAFDYRSNVAETISSLKVWCLWHTFVGLKLKKLPDLLLWFLILFEKAHRTRPKFCRKTMPKLRGSIVVGTCSVGPVLTGPAVAIEKFALFALWSSVHITTPFSTHEHLCTYLQISFSIKISSCNVTFSSDIRWRQQYNITGNLIVHVTAYYIPNL